MSYPRQPVVIVGGILSFPTVYASMRRTLARFTGCPVSIIDIHGYDWMRSLAPSGWTRLLCKLDHTVRLVLEGVSHYTGFGGPWFGAADVIPRWWHNCLGTKF